MNATFVINFDLPKDGIDIKHTLDLLEERLISQALDRTDQSRTQAAELLGLGRTTLVEKMRKHGFKLNPYWVRANK